MSWTFTLSGSAIKKAGYDADSTITNDYTTLTKWSDQAEGRIVAETRRNWVSQYSTISGSAIAALLDDVASSMIAKNIIAFNMANYSRGIAQTMLDVQEDIINSGLKVLSDFKSNDIKDV